MSSKVNKASERKRGRKMNGKMRHATEGKVEGVGTAAGGGRKAPKPTSDDRKESHLEPLRPPRPTKIPTRIDLSINSLKIIL